jgi:hypothetical protein
MYVSDRSFEPAAVVRRRTQIAGVSVSPGKPATAARPAVGGGFHVILQVESDRYLPIRVTSNTLSPQDQFAVTSPEALTLLQLLGNIDLAGAILPPDVLSKLVVLACEQTQDAFVTPIVSHIAQSVQAQLPKNITTSSNTRSTAATYSDLHAWYQARLGLPTCTLDEVWIHSPTDFTLQINVQGFGRVSLQPTTELCQQVLYQTCPETSCAFVSLALALRYKAPVVLVQPDVQISSSSSSSLTLTLHQVNEDFPMFRSVDKIKQESTRVAHNIERSYQVHTLQAAMQLAIRKGDMVAAEKIRAKLDEYDAMTDLPVQEDSDLSEMQ